MLKSCEECGIVVNTNHIKEKEDPDYLYCGQWFCLGCQAWRVRFSFNNIDRNDIL